MGRREWVFGITKTVGRVLLSPFFRLITGGVNNLPQESAFILLPKHQRWEDIPLLGLATPRPLYYVAKSELFTNPLSKWFLVSLGGIPLNRQRPLESRHSIKSLVSLLREGEGAVVFPEGTYYVDKMGSGHVGMIRLILSRVAPPFIPVGVSYSRKGFRTVVRINYGKPVHAEPGMSPRALLDHMMKQIEDLSGLGQEKSSGE
jgi:1-acyl-sn-glycerol-3-phosphate acyltransferase